jgi:prepilin-type N-terminal cleavage/methylation domain-containing protein
MFSFSSTKQGFTLIELIVAIGIFSIVIVLGLGSLLRITNANRYSNAAGAAVENMGFVLEEMSRSLRNGFLYHCDITVGSLQDPRNCGFGGSPASSIAFENIPGDFLDATDQHGYRLENGRIEKFTDGNSGVYVPLTDPSVTITNLRFYVVGTVPGDNIVPRVMILVNGTATTGSVETKFDLQTTVMQRISDAS